MSSEPKNGDEVRLFIWNGTDGHDTYRSLVRNVDTLGGAGGQQPRLDLSYWDGSAEQNANNIRNVEAYPSGLDGEDYWLGTHAKQALRQSEPYASWNRVDTDEGRVCWIYVQSLPNFRKAVITNQRALPGNRIDAFYINIAAGTRVSITNVKAIEDADEETEDHWFRRRLHRGAI